MYEIILINTIFILFPLLLCLMYETYNKTFDREKNNLFLDCALCSSFYFIVRYGLKNPTFLPGLALNIPLVVAYMRERKVSIFLLSICSIFYYSYYFDLPFYLLLIEYGFYYGLFLSYKKEWMSGVVFLNSLIIFKSFFFCFDNWLYHFFPLETLLQVFTTYFLLVVFYALTHFILYLFNKTEEVLALHQTIQDFEEEKQIRASLFKITHEIKNPIAVCKGYLDMFDVNNVEHSRKYIPIMREEIARVLILLQDFLSITKIKIEKEEMDFNLLVEDTIDSFELLLKDREIECSLDISEEEWYLLADYNRLSQVLINIIKNGIESIPEGSKGKLTIKTIQKNNMVQVIVQDNGCGISKENLKKMKEPFFTTKPKGTGLGVYLSQEIVKAHDGTLRYFSKEGKGTTVIASFPYVALKDSCL